MFPTDFQCHQIMVLTPKTPKIACLSSKTEAIMGNNTKQKAFEVVSFLDHKKWKKVKSSQPDFQTRQVNDL